MNSKDTLFSVKQTIKIKGSVLPLHTPLVMGILNITPDSFFDGGRYINDTAIANRCEKMINEGAAIIDIGAYSSRPGATDISEDEEISRLSQALQIIKKQFPEIFLSVDTFRSQVAKKVIEDFGVDMINDISAGTLDPKITDVVSAKQLPYIMMHMRGTPQTMQSNTQYHNVVNDIIQYFAEKTTSAKLAGIHDIIIDPGFGFSKTVEQNFEILNNLEQFKILGKPILVGLSRKSMIYKTLQTNPEGALSGTIAANTVALLKGANILRVHDVKEAIDAISIVKELKCQT